MSKRSLFLTALFCLGAAFFGSSAFAERVQIKNVAVVETQIDERSGAASEINRAEVVIITNELRSEAVKNLPRNRFNIMTSETVQSMGDAILEECAEENCVIALGSKIGADYIVRGIISKFRNFFTLTIEMYETDYGMLVATTGSVRTSSVDELFEKATSASAEMYRKFLSESSPAATVPAPAPTQPVSTPAPVPVSAPPVAPPPPTYALTVNANPSAGGRITRSPNQTNYAAGTAVTLTATAVSGYVFSGWSNAPHGVDTNSASITLRTTAANASLTANFRRVYTLAASARPARGGSVTVSPNHPRYYAGTLVSLTATPNAGYKFNGWTGDSFITRDSAFTLPVNSNLSLTAQFMREKERSSPLKLTMRWGGAALAAGGVIGGIFYNGEVSSQSDNYDNYSRQAPSSQEPAVRDIRDDIENNVNKRNIFFAIAGIGAVAFTVTLFF